MASTWSCVTKIIVAPSCWCSLAISMRICTRSSASRLLKRLVEQEGLGLAHDGAADRHPLALAARELAGLAVHQVLDLEDARGVRHPHRDLVARHAAHAQAKAEVLLHRHMRIERIGLEHHGDAALGRVEVRHILAADEHLAGRRLLEPGYGAQQRGLAAAGGPDEDHELTVLDVEIDIVDARQPRRSSCSRPAAEAQPFVSPSAVFPCTGHAERICISNPLMHIAVQASPPP